MRIAAGSSRPFDRGVPRVVLISAVVEIRARLRDRSLIAGAFVVALLLPLLLSVAIGRGGSTYRPVIGVVVPEEDATADGLFRGLAARDDLRLALRRFPDRPTAKLAVAEGEVEAALVLPRRAETGLAAGEVPEVGVVAASASPLGGQVATAIATSIQDRFAAVASAVRIVHLEHRATDAEVLGALARGGIELELPDLGRKAVPPLAYFGPSLVLLASIFLCGASARSLASERASGLAERWAAGPMPWWAHDLGVGLGAAALALAVSCLCWAVATGAYGVSWGVTAGVAALLIASALAAAALNLLVLRLAGRAGNRIDGATAAVVLLVGMLGGHFVPLYQLPPVLRGASLLTPSGWLLRSFGDMVMVETGPSVAFSAAAVVIAMAVVMFAVALRGAARVGR